MHNQIFARNLQLRQLQKERFKADKQLHKLPGISVLLIYYLPLKLCSKRKLPRKQIVTAIANKKEVRGSFYRIHCQFLFLKYH